MIQRVYNSFHYLISFILIVVVSMEDIIKYINNSKYRAKIIKSLGDDSKFPSVIAKDTDIPQNQVSFLLSGLTEKEIAEVINPEVRKGRTYRLTEYGLDILDKLQYCSFFEHNVH